jgi:hypothetical protein
MKRSRWEDLEEYGKVILSYNVMRLAVWTGVVWLMTETSGRLLQALSRFRFQVRQLECLFDKIIANKAEEEQHIGAISLF